MVDLVFQGEIQRSGKYRAQQKLHRIALKIYHDLVMQLYPILKWYKALSAMQTPVLQIKYFS